MELTKLKTKLSLTRTVRKPIPKDPAIIPQAKIKRVLELIAALKSSRWTIGQLASRFETSTRTIYRYIHLLEAVNFSVEQDFHDRYFIFTSEEETNGTQFSVEETHLLSQLIQSGLRKTPLKASLLKKLSMNSELDGIPNFIIKVRTAKMVETFSLAIKEKKQVILKSYHSANSNDVRDRLVEPISFGDDYQTILALDVADKKCKQFKLERIGDIFIHTELFQFEKYHQKNVADMFGMTGDTTTMVTLRLKMRAYLLLREEFPMAIPFIEKLEDNTYQFHGPVKNFEGVTRFVMGLLDEVTILGPNEFREFLKERMKIQILV
jgi:proteasome accessory factor C